MVATAEVAATRQELRVRTLGAEVSTAPYQAVRLTRCPRCGYALSQLPRRHRCPECGFAYDESMFLLEGWRLPDLRSSVRDAVRYGGGLIIGLLVLRLVLGLPLAVLGLIFAVVTVVAAGLYGYVALRDDTGSRALVRYLISEDGVTRVGRRGRRTYLWRNYSHLSLIADGASGWRLHVYPAWWRLFGPPIVNARLECSGAEAEAVRHEIQRRINASRKLEFSDRAQNMN